MDNFSSGPTRLTNEERFAASKRDRAVKTRSGFVCGVAMSRPSSQSGVSTQLPSLTPKLHSALASARKIDDLDSVRYPEGIKTPNVELNQGQTKGGKYRYDRDFLLQFMQICKDKPDNL
ncbi:hypothetical protein M407DRAFT_33582, partial [Tulasnella calospora MUT 4182]